MPAPMPLEPLVTMAILPDEEGLDIFDVVSFVRWLENLTSSSIELLGFAKLLNKVRVVE